MILNISTFSFGLINTDIFLYELSKIKDTLLFLSNYNDILCRAKLVISARNMAAFNVPMFYIMETSTI